MRLALPAGIQARALLHPLLEHGDVVGSDAARRTVIQLAADDHTLETPLTFEADAMGMNDPPPGVPTSAG